jgi:hypothetical protein
MYIPGNTFMRFGSMYITGISMFLSLFQIDPRLVLPDGIFAYQKSRFGNIFEGLGIENVGIFYSHLVFL